MDWSIFNQWNDYLLKQEHKDIIIHKTIGEFRRVLSDQISNHFFINNMIEKKSNITKDNWYLYGKINNLLDKIKKNNFNRPPESLPRMRCNASQKCHNCIDIKEGNMYNIPAELNGVDTKDNYFYVPIHKTRRHIHGVPKEFLVNYILNMIETATWEKKIDSYYTDSNYIHCCAIYSCPEKYKLKNIVKKEKNKKDVCELKEKEINCTVKICVYTKLEELNKYLKNDEKIKIKMFFYKKLIDNFRLNFSNKARYITYCPSTSTTLCKNSQGYIHMGIPNGHQQCNECMISYCRECGKIPFHDNKLCDITDLQNSSNIMFENPDLYRKCPGCTTWIEKEIGCDHMKCLCGVHFCYNCRMVLCANDPYFHVCSVGSTDPHFRDFPLNHPNVQQSGEIACKCICCSFNM